MEELAVTPVQVAQLQGLVDSGRLTDKLARQVLQGVLADESDPQQKMMTATLFGSVAVRTSNATQQIGRAHV